MRRSSLCTPRSNSYNTPPVRSSRNLHLKCSSRSTLSHHLSSMRSRRCVAYLAHHAAALVVSSAQPAPPSSLQYGAPLAYPPLPPLQGPPRRLQIHAFFGALANVTARVQQGANSGVIPATNAFFQCDPSPRYPNGVCAVFLNPQTGAFEQRGVPENGSLQLQPGTSVGLGVWGCFADVSATVRSFARGPVFDVAVSAAALACDPAPGEHKTLVVFICGGRAPGVQVMAIESEGGQLHVDLRGRIAPDDTF